MKKKFLRKASGYNNGLWKESFLHTFCIASHGWTEEFRSITHILTDKLKSKLTHSSNMMYWVGITMITICGPLQLGHNSNLENTRHSIKSSCCLLERICCWANDRAQLILVALVQPWFCLLATCNGYQLWLCSTTRQLYSWEIVCIHVRSKLIQVFSMIVLFYCDFYTECLYVHSACVRVFVFLVSIVLMCTNVCQT